jgi:hypothetical protein
MPSLRSFTDQEPLLVFERRTLHRSAARDFGSNHRPISDGAGQFSTNQAIASHLIAYNPANDLYRILPIVIRWIEGSRHCRQRVSAVAQRDVDGKMQASIGMVMPMSLGLR